jgi:hypothetical protein
MCSSNLTHHIHKATPPSPVFMQHNILDNAKHSENITSLKDIRTAIHKLLPKDLETPIKENFASTSSDQGLDESPIEGHSGTTVVSCTCDAYQDLLDIVHTSFSQWNNLNILFTKFGSIISPMNSGQNYKPYWIAVDLDSPIANGTNFPICSNKID